jgi:hypothetical protein
MYEEFSRISRIWNFSITTNFIKTTCWTYCHISNRYFSIIYKEYMFLVAGKVLLWDRKAQRRSFFSAREFSFSEIGRLSKSSVARFWQSRSRKRKILSRKRRAWEILYRR